MSTRTSFEYLTPWALRLDESAFTFQSLEGEEGNRGDLHGGAGERGDDRHDVSQDDLGYFMSVASRYQLLTATEERALGAELWRARAMLLRILRRARKTSGRRSISLEPRLGARPVTPSTRRRLARVEKLAREIAERELPAPRGFPASGIRGARRRLEATIARMDAARSRLVEHNLRLIVWVAKSFRGRGFDFIDLIQEGCLGLMRAVDRFDPRVGARFSTFATHWIQQGIRRALAEKARTIRIPVNRIPEVRQTLYARSALWTKLGRTPSPREIAAATGAPLHKVEELLPALGSVESIDAPIPATERRLGDTLVDRSTPTPLEEAMEEETRRAVKTVLHELPQRQRVILSMRHGIGYPRACTLDEIGAALGLSRERIRQVEKAASAAVRDRLLKNRPSLAEPV